MYRMQTSSQIAPKPAFPTMKHIILCVVLGELALAHASLETAGTLIPEELIPEYDPETRIKVACVGDSITAGGHSGGPNFTYPAQLQQVLDKSFPGKYDVQNLGASGATLLMSGDSPYWIRAEYAEFVKQQWDIVVIMLGTNDSKDKGDHGPHNWQHDCTGPKVCMNL